LQPLFVQCLAPAVVCAVAGYLAAPSLNDLGIKISQTNAAFLGACLPVIVFYILIWRGVPDREDRGRVGALLTIFGVVIVFWTVFGLNTTALTEWTRDNTDRVPGPLVASVTDHLEGFAEDASPAYFKNASHETPMPEPGKPLKLINPEVYQSINAAYVVLFTPLVVGFWHFLRLRGWEPSTAGKIGVGLLLTAGGPLIMWWATAATHDGAVKGSSAWLFGTYAMVTLGELCLSPMGLSLVNKTSPANLRAFMMGGWFLSTSIGNKLSGFFGELYQTTDHYIFWPALAGAAAFFALVIFLLLPWLNRQMTERTS
jgi:POT family proton-dependent oligopeptide transporter